MFKNKFLKLFIFVLILIITNIFTALLFYKSNNIQNIGNIELIIKKNSDYKLINPSIDCNDYKYLNTKKIELRISKIIDNFEKNDQNNKISYYVRFLNNGSSFGYNEKDKFMPASLIKVPIAIIYYKLSEDKKYSDILDNVIKTVAIPGDYIKRNIGVDNIKIGEYYKIKDLINSMLINSDNTALYNLQLFMGNIKIINNLYEDLGISKINFIDGGMSVDIYDLSSKDLSSFFRVLYNSSYLNKDNSEELLNILIKSTFKEGIAGLLPKEVKIANKFGEKGFIDSNIKQLHDCGIVYTKTNPYVICIMTKGSNTNELKNTIQKISLEVYKGSKN